jgi:hypothetical protein
MLSPKQVVELLGLSTMGCIAGVPIWLPIVLPAMPWDGKIALAACYSHSQSRSF